MKRNYLSFTLIFLLICFCMFYSVAQRPNIGGYNVYYGHLHNHTSVSDGKGTPDQAYLYARDNAHLDFFSLSEHSEMMSSTEWTTVKNAANKYNADGVFTTFYGFEWSSTNYGHVSVINTSDYCSFLSLSTDNFTELLSWVNARNAIAFFNHPGWAWWSFQEFNHFTNTPSAKFVGMELWNDTDGFGTYYYNDGFYRYDGGKGYFDEALSRGWKIGAAGSDDNHVSTWGTRTPWRLGVLAENLTRTDILDALIARRFFSTLDKTLSLSLKINGAEMGSTVHGGTLNLEIQAKDEEANDAFTKVILMKNGAVAETINLNPWVNNVTVKRTLTGVDKDYFYVKVTQTDGNEAISSPVFIEGTGNIAPEVAITSPANNSSFDLDVPITISADASDVDGTITKVEFYEGTTKLGEDIITPYEYSWTPTTSGNYSLTAKAIDNLDAATVSALISITVSEVVEPPVSTTVEKRISQGSDDAEQYAKGTVVLTDPVLNIVYESKTTGNQIIGLRFTDLTIPQGATIAKAYIEFTTANASSGTGVFTIYGEAADNPSTFLPTSKNISLRKKTVANAGWTAGTWTANIPYQTTDIKTIVQEIVNRTGWTSNYSMAFIITGTGTHTAKSCDGLPDAAPNIHIEYTLTKSGTIQETTAMQTVAKDISEEGILVYPNPVHDVLTVKFDEKTEVERILVYSITGSLVKEIKVNKDMTETQVDCSNFVPGTYLLKLNNSKSSYSMQFIKQ